MKQFIYVVSIILMASCTSYPKLRATKDADGNLVGYATKKDFNQEPYASEWFNNYYSYYETDRNTIEALKPFLKDVSIKVFMGTWCGDSQREIPNFYKILEETNFKQKKLELITVNKQKKANDLEKGYNILRVPTFIFYKSGKEIGRFVEHTINGASLEHDMLQIVANKGYKHAYESKY